MGNKGINSVKRAFNGSIVREQKGENEIFKLSFSSEEPDCVWYSDYPQILDHSEGSVDLKRLKDIGVTLYNHNRNQVIAKIESVGIENNRGVAEISFDSDDESQIIKDKVARGTLKGVSLYATVSRWERVEAGERSSDGRFKGPCDIAKKWEPYEISIVSIPADPTVGVGRSHDNDLENKEEKNNMGKTIKNEVGLTGTVKSTEPLIPTPEAASAPNPAPNTEEANNVSKAVEEATIAERNRVTQIRNICKSLNINPDQFIEKGLSVEKTNGEIIKVLQEKQAPVNVRITKDEIEKTHDAIVDGLLLGQGIGVEKAAPGADSFRGAGYENIMRELAMREGLENPHRMSKDELMRHYFTPASALFDVLEDTANKALKEGHARAAGTFDVWTQKGVLNDFRPKKAHSMLEFSELLPLAEGGELKSGKISMEDAPERKLGEYGRQFSVTRQAIYNDNIELITKLPFKFAESTKRTINKAVYSPIATNAVIYDGNRLFDETIHKNLITPGGIPSKDSLQATAKLIQFQKSTDGEMLAIVPKFIICPIGMGDSFLEIINATNVAYIDNGIAVSQPNPLKNKGWIVVEEATLLTLDKQAGDKSWYMAAGDETVLVDYLNGQEIPTIRRMEYPGQTGIIFDVIFDFGVTISDYRTMAKNQGGK